MQILNVPPFAKHLLQVFLAGFFVDVGDEDDPAFDGADGDGAGGGAGFGCCRVEFGVRGRGGGQGRVDVHFCCGHCRGRWGYE